MHGLLKQACLKSTRVSNKRPSGRRSGTLAQHQPVADPTLSVASHQCQSQQVDSTPEAPAGLSVHFQMPHHLVTKRESPEVILTYN